MQIKKRMKQEKFLSNQSKGKVIRISKIYKNFRFPFLWASWKALLKCLPESKGLVILKDYLRIVVAAEFENIFVFIFDKIRK